MNFRIANTFTASLARLSGPAQKAAAFDLQLDPSNGAGQVVSGGNLACRRSHHASIVYTKLLHEFDWWR